MVRELTEETVMLTTVVVTARMRHIFLLLLLVVVVVVMVVAVDVGVVRLTLMLLCLVVRQLDITAADVFAATVDAFRTARVSVSVHVDRFRLAVATAVGDRSGAGHQRRVGTVLTLGDGVIDVANAAAAAHVVRVTIVDEDGAATALETLTTPAPTTDDDYDDRRQKDDGQRHSDSETGEQRQLQQSRRGVERQGRSPDWYDGGNRINRVGAVVARVADDAVAQIVAVRQRNARRTIETRSQPTSSDVVDGQVCDVGALSPGESVRAETDEVGDQVVASAAVETGRAGTVVAVRLAQNALETDVAVASEVVNSVDAASAVQTRTGATVVDVLLADRTFEASRTHALEAVDSVHALTTCSAQYTHNV